MAPLNFDTLPRPRAVAVADFNGDGIPDIVTANDTSTGSPGTVSVLLGKGDGSFQPSQTLGDGANASCVTVGDFNGDGVPDIAVGYFNGTVRVYLGNGDGTFQNGIASASGGNLLSSIAAADFNGDGRLDLVVGVVNGAHILLGNGDGTFQSPQSLPTGSGPQAVAVGDFNGDHVPDVATTGSGAGGTVDIFLGKGDGTFVTGTTYAAGQFSHGLVVGDFNGDGTEDLAVATYGDTGNPGAVSVLLGNGDGTFQAPRDTPLGEIPQGLTAGDFNGDGKFDLAATLADSSGPLGNSLLVLLGQGDGTFQSSASYIVGSQAGGGDVKAADLNGDGTLDLVVADYGSDEVCVRLGNGDGTFQKPTNYSVGSGPQSIASADFNGNGVQDLVTANYNSNDVSVLLGNGDGSFEPPVTCAAGLNPLAVTIGDFNGDGVPDLAVADGDGTVSVLLGNGDGTFQTAIHVPTVPGTRFVATGDFNGDGIADLVTATDNSVNVLLGNGDGTFGAPVTYSLPGGIQFVKVADLLGNGHLDLITANDAVHHPNSVCVLLGNGDGSFQNAVQYLVNGPAVSVAVGDFNGDGILDLATGSDLLLGNGDGTFQNAIAYGGGGGAVAAVDLNGDGILDLVTAHPYGNDLRVLLGNGDGTFRVDRDYAVGRHPVSLVVSDFNGDGSLDVAVANSDSNDVTILINDGIWSNVGRAPGSSGVHGNGGRTRTQPASPVLLAADLLRIGPDATAQAGATQTFVDGSRPLLSFNADHASVARAEVGASILMPKLDGAGTSHRLVDRLFVEPHYDWLEACDADEA
jgi:hypothetical protein